MILRCVRFCFFRDVALNPASACNSRCLRRRGPRGMLQSHPMRRLQLVLLCGNQAIRCPAVHNQRIPSTTSLRVPRNRWTTEARCFRRCRCVVYILQSAAESATSSTVLIMRPYDRPTCLATLSFRAVPLRRRNNRRRLRKNDIV